MVYVHVGYARAKDKKGRPLAAAYYTGQVGFHDTLYVSMEMYLSFSRPIEWLGARLV